MGLYSTYPTPVAAQLGLIFLLFAFCIVIYIIITETISNKNKKFESFRTKDEKEYYSFLENFDETKYELVDISPKEKSDKFYVVTYRKKTK